MDASMDILPFSLSCDRCDFRTKSMSAMRQHAETHRATRGDTAHKEEGAADVQRGGMNDGGEYVPTFQDEGGNLLALQTGNTSNKSEIEISRRAGELNSSVAMGNDEDGRGQVLQDRTDATKYNMGDVGVVDKEETKKEELPVRGHSDSVMKDNKQMDDGSTADCGEILSGIYEEGIDFGTMDGMDKCVSGLQDVCKDGDMMDVAVDGKEKRDEDRNVMEGTDSDKIRDGDAAREVIKEIDTTVGKKDDPYSDATLDTDVELKKEDEDMPDDGKVGETFPSAVNHSRRSAGGRAVRGGNSIQIPSRPNFHFMIHPSAFTKVPPLTKDPSPPPMPEGITKPVKRLEVVTTALRTRGQKPKPVPEKVSSVRKADVVPPTGRRRVRKPVCPVKVIIPPPKKPAKPVKVTRSSRLSSRPSRDEWKKTRYKCMECSFACKFKKELAAHTKLAHAKHNRLGKVKFDISNRRSSKPKVDLGTRRMKATRTRIVKAVKEDDNDHRPYRRGRRAATVKRRVVRVNVRARMAKEKEKAREREREKEKEREREREREKEKEPSSESDDEDENSSDSESSSSDEEEDSMRGADNEDSVCNICQKFIADSPADMKRHKSEMHDDKSRNSVKQLHCSQCNYACQFRKTLAAHIHNVHSDSAAAKAAKPRSVSRSKSRKEPLVIDTNRVYRCNICVFVCHTSHQLNSHMKTDHNFEKMSGEFKCNECGKVVNGRYSHFRRHLRTHSDERPYKCNECPLAFRDINSLNCHKPIHKEERDYLCEECGMAFKRPINLRMHRKVHTEKAFVCDVCDYRCRRRNTLINHKKRKHLKQRTILCQHCGHCFFSKTECRNHVAKKHMPRPTPFACPVCPSVFMFQYRFRAHLKTHREIKPYKCTFCGFETRLNSYLLDHMRQHTGEKPKKCDQCDYETSTNSNLYKHKKRHHGPGLPGKMPRSRKSRNKSLLKDSCEIAGGEENKDPAGKGVEEMVGGVEFGQLPTQVSIPSSQAAAMFSMPPICSSAQEMKQEQIMQVPPVDVHPGPPLITGQVNVVCPVSEPHHDDRMTVPDKTSSSVAAAMMEALAEARNMRQPTHQPPAPPHHNPYIHLGPQSAGNVPNTTAHLTPHSHIPRVTSNMTMHYSHPNISSTIGGNPGGMPTHYHHLSALAGEAASRTPITSHGQPTHNPTIPPSLLGVGQVPTPPPLGHFPNMMHF